MDRIVITVGEHCGFTFDIIASSVAYTWFHGTDDSASDWIDDGLANAIKQQLVKWNEPNEIHYPPVTYCKDYRNIRELEQDNPLRAYINVSVGYGCNSSLGDGIFGALRDYYGDAEFNRLIAQLAKKKSSSADGEHAIADIREADGRRVAAEIAEAGGEAMFVSLNVSDEDSWIAAVEQVVGRYGKLDVLVNNAGISGSGETDFRSTDAWDRLLDINARGVFLGTKHAVAEMQKAGGGSIVNISSISGIVGQESVHPGYNASKGAVRLLTKATAVQHAKDGIRINSVHPGMMPPMLTSFQRGDARRERLINDVPMQREGRTIEVANAVLFLASDEASYITGAELVVDGGFTAR